MSWQGQTSNVLQMRVSYFSTSEASYQQVTSALVKLMPRSCCSHGEGVLESGTVCDGPALAATSSPKDLPMIQSCLFRDHGLKKAAQGRQGFRCLAYARAETKRGVVSKHFTTAR